VDLWALLSFLEAKSNKRQLTLCISREDGEKHQYDVFTKAYEEGQQMFVFKDISLLKELEKNKAT